MESKTFFVNLKGVHRWSFKFYVDGLDTICILADLVDGKTRAGVSRFNESDADKYDFDLSTGRKHALEHALDNSELPKWVKKLFFDRFFTEHERRDIWNRKNSSEPLKI